MIADKKLSVYFSLQKIILTATENLSMDIFLQECVNRLNFIGFPVSFLAAAFIEEDKQYFTPSPTTPNAYIKPQTSPSTVLPLRKIQKSALIQSPSNQITPLQDLTIALNSQLLLTDTDWGRQLRRGQSLVLIDPSSVLLDTYPKKAEIKTLFVCPSYTVNKQEVWLILASPKTHHEHTEEDFNLIKMVSSLLTLSLKIEQAENLKNSISQEVYKMNVKLHELDKLKDDFVSVASHELRTPMTAIRSYAWMALHKADIPLTEKMKRYLTRTIISTERLINLVNDMLNISRIESGRIEINSVPFDMLKLTAEVLNEVGPKAAEKSLHIQSLNSPLPAVFGDPDKVHQVLLNLVGNAMKFTPVNGQITISYFTDGLVVEVFVKDSGVGILKDDLGRLFKKFGRLDNSYVASATSGGTGLGLYISKSIVELMKGRIWGTSEGVGKGSTFAFSLPIATPDILAHTLDYAKKAAEGEAKNLEPVAI